MSVLIMLVLGGELGASIHRPPLIAVPRSLSPIATAIRHDSARVIATSRHARAWSAAAMSDELVGPQS